MSDEDLETFTHRCLVRWLLQKRAKDGNEAVMRWLEDFRSARPNEARRKYTDRLLEDARYQWSMGNRGFEKGEWRA